MLLIRIYRYTCACPCMSLGIHHTTHWEVSDSAGPTCSDLRVWSLWILSVADQGCAAKHGSSADHPECFPFRPPARLLSFLFVTRERLLYGSWLYIFLYSRICAYPWCNILVILCHILRLPCNCTHVLECIMHHVFLLVLMLSIYTWGYFHLRLYVIVTFLCPWDRGVTGWYQSLGSHIYSTTSRQINGKENCNWNAWSWLYNLTTSAKLSISSWSSILWFLNFFHFSLFWFS